MFLQSPGLHQNDVEVRHPPAGKAPMEARLTLRSGSEPRKGGCKKYLFNKHFRVLGTRYFSKHVRNINSAILQRALHSTASSPLADEGIGAQGGKAVCPKSHEKW